MNAATEKPKLLVLASGRGSNFSALLRACREGALFAEISALGVSKRECGAADIAREAGIEVLSVPFETELAGSTTCKEMFDHLFPKCQSIQNIA